jgi:hypothetical protein
MSFDPQSFQSEGGQEFEVLPEGKYTAKTIDVEEKVHDEHGIYHSYKWQIINPEEHRNRIIWENFYFNHADPQIRKMCVNMYGVFMKQVGNLEKGSHPDPAVLLNKVCTLCVWVRESKCGRYTNNSITKREPVDGQDVQEESQTVQGFHLPETPVPSTADLNDEVPF